MFRLQRWLRRLIYPFWLLDAGKKYRWIKDFLNPDDAILELGSGMGSVVQVLRRHGHRATPVDVCDTSLRPDLQPIIYDGIRLPYRDQEFDVCLLLTVLHHCDNPDRVLAEAARVARRVIVIEDVFNNVLQQRLTAWLDSLLNWEFRGHPHNNRSDMAWRHAFEASGYRLIYASKQPVAVVFCQVTYVLEGANT